MLLNELLYVCFLLICTKRCVNSQRRLSPGYELEKDVEKGYLVYITQAPPFANKYDNWICGGAIVSASLIITSAACVSDVEYMYAIAGYNTYVRKENIDKNTCTNRSKKKIVVVCVPRTYNFGYSFDRWTQIDIAVVKVETPYQFDVPLAGCSWAPSKIAINYDVNFQNIGRDATVYGWGHRKVWRLATEKNQIDNNRLTLAYARLTIDDIHECIKKYNKSQANYNVNSFATIMQRYMICTSKVEGNIDSRGKLVKEIKAKNSCGNNTLRIGDTCMDYKTYKNRLYQNKGVQTRQIIHPPDQNSLNQQNNAHLQPPTSNMHHSMPSDLYSSYSQSVYLPQTDMNSNQFPPQINMNLNLFPPQTDMKFNQFPPQIDMNLNPFPPQTVKNLHRFPPQIDVNWNQFPPQTDMNLNQYPPQKDMNLNQFPPQKDMNLNEFPHQADINLNRFSPQTNIYFNKYPPQKDMKLIQFPPQTDTDMNLNPFPPQTDINLNQFPPQKDLNLNHFSPSPHSQLVHSRLDNKFDGDSIGLDDIMAGYRRLDRHRIKRISTKSKFKESRRQSKPDLVSSWEYAPAICQNDHGGPLVTWIGKREYIIGVSSVFRVSQKSYCIGPNLFTSTSCNGAFINCIVNALDNETSSMKSTRRCINLPSGTRIHRRQIQWPVENESIPDILER